MNVFNLYVLVYVDVVFREPHAYTKYGFVSTCKSKSVFMHHVYICGASIPVLWTPNCYKFSESLSQFGLKLERSRYLPCLMADFGWQYRQSCPVQKYTPSTTWFSLHLNFSPKCIFALRCLVILSCEYCVPSQCVLPELSFLLAKQCQYVQIRPGCLLTLTFVTQSQSLLWQSLTI